MNYCSFKTACCLFFFRFHQNRLKLKTKQEGNRKLLFSLLDQHKEMFLINFGNQLIYPGHSTIYTVHYKFMYIVQYTFHIVPCTLYIVHYNNVNCSLCFVHCTLYIVQCTLCIVDCTYLHFLELCFIYPQLVQVYSDEVLHHLLYTIHQCRLLNKSSGIVSSPQLLVGSRI